MSHNAVVIVHIDETLSDYEIHNVERNVSTEDGVHSACMNARTRHLMIVDYDAKQIKSVQLLGQIRSQGLNAKLVGGI